MLSYVQKEALSAQMPLLYDNFANVAKNTWNEEGTLFSRNHDNCKNSTHYKHKIQEY